MKRNNITKCSLLLVVVALFAMGTALAWQDYSVSKNAGYCADCHGNFRSKPYVEPGTGVSWGDSLHNGHQDMVSDECNVCHLGSKFPVKLAQSAGGNLLDPLGCAGCHGRAEDGTGGGTQGYSKAQRQHHHRSEVTICATCHADANPATVTPAGEATLPPYYADPDSPSEYPFMPQDPCNDPFNAITPEEDSIGAPQGLDNDGDLAYDVSDPDCTEVVESPGETSGPTLALMLVTGHDPMGRTLDISYDSACGTSDNTIVYGPLDQVSTYGYNGEECHCLNTESFTWGPYPSHDTLDSFFFLLVGNDGTHEGSYGQASNASERNRHTGNLACPMGQDLANRCD